MVWIVGSVIYFFLVMLLTAPFILSSRISREEESRMYEKARLNIAGDEAAPRSGYYTRVKKGNRGLALEKQLPYPKHLPLGGRSSG